MTNQRKLPVWRSLLYVPANVERFVARAHERGADGIILDLEDSVPLAEKASARAGVQAAAERVGQAGADVLVRVNQPLRLAVRDIEASVSPAVAALALPKLAGPDHVRLLDELVSELEAERGMTVGATAFLAMIETPEAFFQIGEIAKASPRIAAITIGAEDLASSLGMEPDAETLLYPKTQSVYAAKAAGVMALGIFGTVADYQDLDAVREVALKARRFGLEGASCIHPSVVPVLNEAFSPGELEVALAKRIIEANAEAEKTGRGSFQLDGKMIDVPVVLARPAAPRAPRSNRRARLTASRGRSRCASRRWQIAASPSSQRSPGS